MLTTTCWQRVSSIFDSFEYFVQNKIWLATDKKNHVFSFLKKSKSESKDMCKYFSFVLIFLFYFIIFLCFVCHSWNIMLLTASCHSTLNQKTWEKNWIFSSKFTGKHAGEFHISYVKEILLSSGKEDINTIILPVIVKNIFLSFLSFFFKKGDELP